MSSAHSVHCHEGLGATASAFLDGNLGSEIEIDACRQSIGNDAFHIAAYGLRS